MTKSINLIFLYNGIKKNVNASIGDSILEVANKNDIPLMGNCGGAISCGTCHIKFNKDTFNILTPATEDEEDILDIVISTPTSRLGCCVLVSEELNGAEITIA